MFSKTMLLDLKNTFSVFKNHAFEFEKHL